MKLRNKKTGEIGLVHCDATMFSNKIGVFIDNNHIDLRNPYKIYTSLAELKEEWEDYNELEYWYIDNNGDVLFSDLDEEKIWEDLCEERKQIGNRFETKEEAEKAVEKLKAWKRLKDKGFEIEGWDNNIGDDYYKTGQIVLNLNNVRNREWDEYDQIMEIKNDLDLLFGGEE